MKELAQRIAIAEFCGWTQHSMSRKQCYDPSGMSCYWDDTPDYPNDLNAMHEAIELLRGDQFRFVDYPGRLFRVVSGREWDGDMGYFAFNFVNATAAQRAESLLKTIGKWEE